jgi:hypothetical protein
MIQAELFATPVLHRLPVKPPELKVDVPNDMPAVIERLAVVSTRPRYAFMVLNLIARAAGQEGRAGPYVFEQGRAIRLRDWLCDALSPMAGRDPKRVALVQQVRTELEEAGALPNDPLEFSRAVDDAVRSRVSGRSLSLYQMVRPANAPSLTRARSALVRAVSGV